MQVSMYIAGEKQLAAGLRALPGRFRRKAGFRAVADAGRELRTGLFRELPRRGRRSKTTLARSIRLENQPGRDMAVRIGVVGQARRYATWLNYGDNSPHRLAWERIIQERTPAVVDALRSSVAKGITAVAAHKSITAGEFSRIFRAVRP